MISNILPLSSIGTNIGYGGKPIAQEQLLDAQQAAEAAACGEAACGDAQQQPWVNRASIRRAQEARQEAPEHLWI